MIDTRKDAAEPEKPLGSGIRGLDEILCGGVSRHHIYLIEGAPGTGKTTLGLQFLREGVRQGEAVLLATLSETEQELRQIARSHGWDLAGVPIHDLTPEDERLDPGEQYTLFHPSEVEFGESVRRLLDAVEAAGPSRLVIDSMTELRLLAREPLQYRRQILMLRRFLATRKCTVFLLDDEIEEPDLQLHSIAHGVVRLEHWSPEYGPERRRIIVPKVRGRTYHGGYHDLRIVTGGLEVFPRISVTASAPECPASDRSPLPSGNVGLDALVGGGIEPGTSVLVMGPAGAGKSTLALQWLLVGAENGRRGAIYSFDELRSTYLARCAGLGSALSAHLDAGRLELAQIDPAGMSPGEFAAGIRRAVVEQGVKSVLLDSLNGYLWSMEGEENLVRHLRELLGWLHARDVLTVMVLSQQGLLGQDAPIDLSYLADTVILLRYFEAAGLVRKALSVVKKRIGGHESSIREFGVTGRGIEVGEPLREFQGVLAGTPEFTGEKARLLDRESRDG